MTNFSPLSTLFSESLRDGADTAKQYADRAFDMLPHEAKRGIKTAAMARVDLAMNVKERLRMAKKKLEIWLGDGLLWWKQLQRS